MIWHDFFLTVLPGLISALGAQSELDALDSVGDDGLTGVELGLTVAVGSIDSGCLSDSIDSDITH